MSRPSSAQGAAGWPSGARSTGEAHSLLSDAQEAFAPIPCAHCGALFTPRRDWARFCCRECRLAAAGLTRKPRAIENCQYCGASLAGKRSHAKYCSPACRLAAHKTKNGPRQAHVEDRGEA